MNGIFEQGIAELVILFVCEIKDKPHQKLGHALDFLLEFFIYTLVFFHEYKSLRWSGLTYREKSRVDNPAKQYFGFLKLVNLIVIGILVVMSLAHDNELMHIAQNVIQGLLLYFMIRHYQNLLTFCEAVLFTKVCTDFLCLLFQFVPHYGSTIKDITQVADLFLISSVLIPLLCLLLFRYVTKTIVIPLSFIALQLFLLVKMVHYDPMKLVNLTLSETNSLRCLIYMLTVTLLGIALSEIFQSKLSKIMVRKIFHFQVVLIFTVGIYIAPRLTLMASSGLIWIFFLSEFLRQEFSSDLLIINRFDQFVSKYIDDRDCKQLILTHIYLLLGVAYPFIYEYGLQSHSMSLFYEKALSGVIVLGIGDSFAAIIGKSFGQIKLFKTEKTLEGFAAFIISIIVFVKFFNYFIIRDEGSMIVMNDWFYIKVVFIAFIECVTRQVDNLLLPMLFMSF